MPDDVFEELTEGVKRDLKRRIHYEDFCRLSQRRALTVTDETSTDAWVTTRSLDWKLLHSHAATKNPGIQVPDRELSV